MPSVSIGNRTVQSSSPEVGQSGAQTEAMKQILGIVEKKVRNMEKKKSKLDDYQARKNKGEHLNQDQLEALSKYQEVVNNLEFARELQKSFLALGQDIQKAVKKAARREQLQREEAEQRRLKAVLEVQFLLDKLGEETLRQELKQASLLTDEDLAALDEFYKLVGPDRDQNIRLTDQYEQASQHFWELLEGRDKEVAGTTYKALKDTLDKVLLTGYFDRAHGHQNGVCEEGEEQPQGRFTVDYTEPIEVETAEFVNRQFIPEANYSSTDQEQTDEWNTESEVCVVQSAPSPVMSEPHVHNPVPPMPSADPVVRKQAVQDLMAQMQGPYNFMQDSMLEFDSQAIDPAIVSAQPMKPTQSMDMPQMVLHPDARLTQPSTIPVPMVTPTPEAFSTPPPLYQSAHPADPRPPTDAIDPIQASMSLSSEQSPPSSSLPAASQPQVFQPVSKPLRSSGINVNAAPFQSMQTVFNLNAPVPPASETESLKQPSQYPSGYSQGFSGQAQHATEQPDMPQEQLQSVVGTFHAQDQTLSSAAGHQPSQQGPAFSRTGQSFYNSRAMSRGGPRNARGMINGYRGPSNGFRGGYDGYRPPFSNTPNSGYGQPQFGTPRDYSNSSYQREGYQQNFKRGAGQGTRGCSRGNAQVMRS
uniref:Cell cycle associated protein 1 n=1 Tax=Scleropages formosus TaxID=113540 RepID=A0A8C9S0U5_SCLFO